MVRTYQNWDFSGDSKSMKKVILSETKFKEVFGKEQLLNSDSDIPLRRTDMNEAPTAVSLKLPHTCTAPGSSRKIKRLKIKNPMGF